MMNSSVGAWLNDIRDFTELECTSLLLTKSISRIYYSRKYAQFSVPQSMPPSYYLSSNHSMPPKVTNPAKGSHERVLSPPCDRIYLQQNGYNNHNFNDNNANDRNGGLEVNEHREFSAQRQGDGQFTSQVEIANFQNFKSDKKIPAGFQSGEYGDCQVPNVYYHDNENNNAAPQPNPLDYDTPANVDSNFDQHSDNIDHPSTAVCQKITQSKPTSPPPYHKLSIRINATKTPIGVVCTSTRYPSATNSQWSTGKDQRLPLDESNNSDQGGRVSVNKCQHCSHCQRQWNTDDLTSSNSCRISNCPTNDPPNSNSSYYPKTLDSEKNDYSNFETSLNNVESSSHRPLFNGGNPSRSRKPPPITNIDDVGLSPPFRDSRVSKSNDPVLIIPVLTPPATAGQSAPPINPFSPPIYQNSQNHYLRFQIPNKSAGSSKYLQNRMRPHSDYFASQNSTHYRRSDDENDYYSAIENRPRPVGSSRCRPDSVNLLKIQDSSSNYYENFGPKLCFPENKFQYPIVKYRPAISRTTKKQIDADYYSNSVQVNGNLGGRNMPRNYCSPPTIDNTPNCYYSSNLSNSYASNASINGTQRGLKYVEYWYKSGSVGDKIINSTNNNYKRQSTIVPMKCSPTNDCVEQFQNRSNETMNNSLSNDSDYCGSSAEYTGSPPSSFFVSDPL